MGKLRTVLSRRILWFKRQRMTTAAAAFLMVTAAVACGDDDVVGPTTAEVSSEEGALSARPRIAVSVNVGDTALVSLNNNVVKRIQRLQGSASTASARVHSSGDFEGVSFAGLEVGRVRYRIHYWVGKAVKKQAYDVTVTPPVIGTQVTLDGTEYVVREGDTLQVHLTLSSAAKARLEIPFTVRTSEIPDSIRSLAYNWTALDAQEADYTVMGGVSFFTVEKDETDAMVQLHITDDQLIEPPQEEVLTFKVDLPTGYSLDEGTGSVTFQIAEGVCDRTGAALREAILIEADWEEKGCSAVTSLTLANVIYPSIKGAGESGHLPDVAYRLGDFAGLTGVRSFHLNGFDAEGTDWSQGLFRDLGSLPLFGKGLKTFELYRWRLRKIPVGMFVGINTEYLESVTLAMASRSPTQVDLLPAGLQEAAREGNAYVIEDGALSPFNYSGQIELNGFHTTELTSAILGDVSDLASLKIVDWPYLEDIDADAFSTLADLQVLWLSKSPQITDEHLQTTPPLLSAQVGTLVGLDLSGLGLANFQLKKLFPNQPNVVAALSLDDNQYTSTGRIFSARNRFSELRAVFLRNNRLNSLDQGGFWGLRLGLLALDGNPGAPFAVEPRLQVKDGTNQVRAQFNIAIPATTTFQVYGTNMTVDAFELVIPAGTNVSEWVEPSRDNQTLPVLLRSSLLAEMPMTYTGLKLTPPEEALSAAKLWWNRGDGANRLPVLVKAFESLKIFIGSSVSNEEYSSVVLSDHVRPVNVSRALTFEIVSSDPAVATATLNDDMLTVNAHADGGAILTVNATDHNVTQPFTFDVTVATIDRTGYNIDVHKIGAAETNATISNAIDRAVAFWESTRILRWRIVGRPEGDYDRRLWRLGAGGGVFGAGPGLGGGPAGLGRGPERLAETRGVGAAARRLRKAGVGAGQI